MVTSNLAFKEKNSIEPEVVVNESPVKWCAVALSDVVARGKRLEASVFDVEAKQARMLISKGKYPQSFIGGTDGMTSSYVCGRFKRIWVEKSDMPIISHPVLSILSQLPVDTFRRKRKRISAICV